MHVMFNKNLFLMNKLEEKVRKEKNRRTQEKKEVRKEKGREERRKEHFCR